MKKVLITLCLFFIVINTYAISLGTGSLEELARIRRSTFEIDYSNASIHGMSVAYFAKYEPDWEKDQLQIISSFIGELTDITPELLFQTKSSNYELTLRWVILHISTKGDITSELHLLNHKGELVAKIIDLEGKGGIFGSKLNLIKDGAKDSGKFLKIELKKYSKSNKTKKQ